MSSGQKGARAAALSPYPAALTAGSGAVLMTV
jgi:hypothetical protein